MIQRIKDFMLEMRIQRLYKQLIDPANKGNLYDICIAYRDAINSRSEGQVKRMESKFMESGR
jgi:hypothetical protein